MRSTPDQSAPQASTLRGGPSEKIRPLMLYAVLPVLLLLMGGLAAFLVLREPLRGTYKIALIHAFAGPLQVEGYDALTATRAGVRAETAGKPLFHGYRIVVEAFDDGGTLEGATVARRALDYDPSILQVVCCSTNSVTLATQLLLTSAHEETSSVALPLVSRAPAPSYLVDTASRLLRADRPVLIRSRNTVLSPAAAAVVRNWPAAPIISFSPEQGDRPDAVAATVAKMSPDILILELDAAAVARILGALRPIGVAVPAVGSPDIGSAALVNWLEDRLGQLYIPAFAAESIPEDLMKATIAERGHAPSSPDVVIYWTVRRALAKAVGDSAGLINRQEPEWIMQRLDPGRFPGTVVTIPPP